MSVGRQFLSLTDAAAYGSATLNLRVTEADLTALIDVGVVPVYEVRGVRSVRPGDVSRFAAQFRPHMDVHGLFTDITRLISGIDNEHHSRLRGPLSGEQLGCPVVFLTIKRGLGISFDGTMLAVERIQMLLSVLREDGGQGGNSQRQDGPDNAVHRIDLDPSVTIWSSNPINDQWLRARWADILSDESTTAFAEALVTPRIFGNKSRLTQFITAVAKRYVPPGSAICDLMAGSGIVTQKLSNFYDVFANDANAFASLLTKCQAMDVTERQTQSFIEGMKPYWEQNALALRELLARGVAEESHFLRGRVEPSTLAAYRAFCEQTANAYGTGPSNVPSASADDGFATLTPPATSDLTDTLTHLVAQRRADPTLFPYCLVSAYFANAYFGLAQSIAIDSIRFAIERCANPETKEFFLGGLLLAAFSCSSGPHFAQPPKLSSERAMREILEHRSRDVLEEFLMLIRMLQKRQSRQGAVKAVWRDDWRKSLARFVDETKDYSKGRRAVYIDPPYSKLQYSRYYHVLNTVLDYNYPVSTGVGRYPPRTHRFSSRFEYQPAPALRELDDLCSMCADAELTTILSYSSRGLIPLPDIIVAMEARFPRVDVFTKAVRHHSQGVVLEVGRQNVTEYLLVGVSK